MLKRLLGISIILLSLIACSDADLNIEPTPEVLIKEVVLTATPEPTATPSAIAPKAAPIAVALSPEVQIKDWIKGLRIGTVSRVIDGDTIELVSGEKIRYLEVSTPEIHNSTECYGQEANTKNKELVLGKTIYIRPPTQGNKTSYNRTLAYVFTDEYFVNKKLVEEGYAIVELYAKANEFYDLLKKSEDEAKFKNLGLWNKCNSVKP